MKEAVMIIKHITERIDFVLHAEAESIELLRQTIDHGQTTEVVKCILHCKKKRGRVIITACGTSAATAKKIVHSLCCIEVPAVFLSPGDAVHGALGLVQSNDIVIMISKGGNTAELIRLIPAFKAKKIRIIGVGENPESAIGTASDVFLKIKIDREPDFFNMLATASAMAVIAVFDGIIIALMEKTGFTREQFAVIHPSGAVGERLLKGEQ
jgi:KpsF/GutQ family protein